MVDVDEILVLHEGKIVERGTHNELLIKEGGRYAEMWELQAKVHEPMAKELKAADAEALEDR